MTIMLIEKNKTVGIRKTERTYVDFKLHFVTSHSLCNFTYMFHWRLSDQPIKYNRLFFKEMLRERYFYCGGHLLHGAPGVVHKQ